MIGLVALFDKEWRVRRWLGIAATALTAIVASSCSTAMNSAHTAAKAGDWDTAVAQYREIVANNPKNLDARIALEKALREAATEHAKRAQALEAQDQLPGAIAEYKRAADFDPPAPYPYPNAPPPQPHPP